MLYAHEHQLTSMHLLNHPFWQEHSHILLHFIKLHTIVMTRKDNGKDNTETYSFMVSTIDCNFEFHANLIILLF